MTRIQIQLRRQDIINEHDVGLVDSNMLPRHSDHTFDVAPEIVFQWSQHHHRASGDVSNLQRHRNYMNPFPGAQARSHTSPAHDKMRAEHELDHADCDTSRTVEHSEIVSQGRGRRHHKTSPVNTIYRGSPVTDETTEEVWLQDYPTPDSRPEASAISSTEDR